MVLDPMYFANTPEMRRLIQEQLSTEGVESFDYQIISIGEIEDSMEVIKSHGLGALMRQKMANTVDPLRSTAFISFREFLGGLAPSGPYRHHPLHFHYCAPETSFPNLAC